MLQNLDDLVIKPIDRSFGNYAIFGASLSQREKEQLRMRIRAKPHLYVGQEQVSFSTVPALDDGAIEPRHAILRTFMVAREHDYVAMPGGLTRVAPQKDTFVVSNQAGGVSKDTWVLASEPEKQITMWAQPRRDHVAQPASGVLPSRAADNLFWVGRYLERAEAAARLMRTVLQKLRETRESGDESDRSCLHVLLRALTHVTSTYPGFVGEDTEALLHAPRDELLSLARDSDRFGSLPSTLQSFTRAAFSVRDLWSSDTWRTVEDMQRHWRRGVMRREVNVGSLQDNLDDLITGIVAFGGLTTESMPREAGWLMLEIGRRLERASLLISLVRGALVPRHADALENQVMESVLLTNESLITYRRRYRSFLQLPTVLELILIDEHHPRALLYQLDQLKSHITALPRERRHERLSQEERLILKAHTQLRLTDVLALTRINENDGVYTQLDGVLAETGNSLWQISDAITQTYFSHAQGPQQLGQSQLDDEM